MLSPRYDPPQQHKLPLATSSMPESLGSNNIARQAHHERRWLELRRQPFNGSYLEGNITISAEELPNPSKPDSALAPLAKIANKAAAQIAKIKLLIRASSNTNAEHYVCLGTLWCLFAPRFPFRELRAVTFRSAACSPHASAHPKMRHSLIECSRTPEWSNQCC